MSRSPVVMPRNPLLRWIGEDGGDLPPQVRERLLETLFGAVGPLVVGALNGIVLSLVAYFRTGVPVLLWLAVLDGFLLLARVAFIRSRSRRVGPLLCTGLVWAAIQAATLFIVVTSHDLAMIVVTLASGFALVGGIIGRNFVAPRYAMAQALMIDLSFKIGLGLHYPEFIPLILPQSMLFAAINLSLIRRNRELTIQAILGEMENRTQSLTDPLTKLLNRRGLEDAYEALQDAGTRPSLFYLDLDGFKQVNDRLGHRAGDLLLVEVGARLSDICGPESRTCRLGGDEFLVLVDLPDEKAIRSLGARLVVGLSAPYQLDPAVLARVGLSIGVARPAEGKRDLAALMEAADRALYVAKAEGKGRCVVFGDSSARRERALTVSVA